MLSTEVSAEELDQQPIVETTEQTTEYAIPCIRCEKRNHANIQILGVANTPLGISGISLTRHLLDRTSIQGGVGYGLGGVNLNAAVLHYLEKDNSLHISTGLSLTTGIGEKRQTKQRKECLTKRKKCQTERKKHRSDHHDDESSSQYDDDNYRVGDYFEGLWINLGFGVDIATQSGISYGVDFGVSMAVLSDVLSSDIKLCFGAISADSCQEPWRILPYLTLLKLGYSW